MMMKLTEQYLISLGLKPYYYGSGKVGLPNGFDSIMSKKFRNGTLTKKELRDDRDKRKRPRDDDEYDGMLFDSDSGRYVKRYDARIDITAPTPHECMKELVWLLDPDNEMIKIDDEPIKAHHVIKSIKEGNECIICQFEDNDVGPDDLVECFSSYTNDKYHPLHQHGIIMSSIYAKLIYINKLRTIYHWLQYANIFMI